MRLRAKPLFSYGWKTILFLLGSFVFRTLRSLKSTAEALEHRPSQKKITSPNHGFSEAMLVSGKVCQLFISIYGTSKKPIDHDAVLASSQADMSIHVSATANIRSCKFTYSRILLANCHILFQIYDMLQTTQKCPT